ncbi:MAG: type III polyketide synthase [Janthinobacterium lividum]
MSVRPLPLPGPSGRPASRVVAIEAVLPAHRYDQAEISAHLAPLLTPDPLTAPDAGRRTGTRRQLLHRLHAASGVAQRHLALPLQSYARLGSFDVTNAAFVEVGLDLAARAVKGALASAGLRPDEVDFLFFTTVTGVAAPSLDALLVPAAGLRPNVKRVPSFGLGCVAGAAGIARVDDYLAGHPEEVGLLVSVELCSLTLQRDDTSVANLVASGLFGDGASAAVLAGSARSARTPGWDVVRSESRLYPGTADALGWDVGSSGFRIVLSPGLPDILARHLGDDVTEFLAPAGGIDAVDRWVVHPGGPKILQVLETALNLPADALAPSWASLRDVGNLSSSSVLHILAAMPCEAGEVALVLGVGPGVSTELVLLRAAST